MYTTVTSLEIIMTGVDFSSYTNLGSAVIARAEARINGALARRYDLSSAYFQTTTSVPPAVREWATQLAAGYAWKEVSRGGAGKECLKRGESMIKDVMEDLGLLGKGELPLTDTSGALISELSLGAGAILCSTSQYYNTFDEGDELSWRVDPDKLSNIRGAK